MLRCLARGLVGAALGALAQAAGGFLQLRRKAVIQGCARCPACQQLQDALAGNGVVIHLEAQGVAHQFVGVCGKQLAKAFGLAPVLADLLPGIQYHPGLGGYTAGEVLPEFFFLALVVHGAPACVLFMKMHPIRRGNFLTLVGFQSL